MQTSLKLSKTSKLDGIMSWSLQAIETCPGSVASNGGLVDACKGCYATTGNYNYPNVKAPRQANKLDWQRDDFVTDFVAALQKQSFFRWFDSGDVYSVDLAEKIYAIMAATPNVKHWLPTRMYKFAKFADVLQRMKALPNVSIRFSSDAVDGSYTEGVHGSTIVPTASEAGDDVTVCRAYDHGGKCNGCRACWDKSVNVIGYVAHGAKMGKVIRIAKAAA